MFSSDFGWKSQSQLMLDERLGNVFPVKTTQSDCFGVFIFVVKHFVTCFEKCYTNKVIIFILRAGNVCAATRKNLACRMKESR